MTVTVNGHTCTLADNVKETTSTTGTGTYQLNGAASGFVSFASGIGNGNKTLYRAQLGTAWEIGIGTFATGSPPTLARTAILKSSNSDNAVSWSAGAKDIFVVVPTALLDQIGTEAGLPGSDTISNSILSNMGAWTFKVRNAGTTGDPSDAGMSNITTDVVPADGDFLIGFTAADGAIRKWTVSSIQPTISTTIASTKVTVFTASGTWTRDAKCIEAEVHGVGAGGGGGGAQVTGANESSEGGGGGGGAYCYSRLSAASLGTSVTVTIGQGGAGGGGAATGASGGTTFFGSHLDCDGGTGGVFGQASEGNREAAGGSGGTQAASLGQIIIPGGFGGMGRTIATGGFGTLWIGANFGGAGAGPWGGQSVGGKGSGNGFAGRIYGGGGMGAHIAASTAAATGGDGADGIVVVIERLSP